MMLMMMKSIRLEPGKSLSFVWRVNVPQFLYFCEKHKNSFELKHCRRVYVTNEWCPQYCQDVISQYVKVFTLLSKKWCSQDLETISLLLGVAISLFLFIFRSSWRLSYCFWQLSQQCWPIDLLWKDWKRFALKVRIWTWEKLGSCSSIVLTKI